jgi:hypothetical protein
MSEDHSIAFRPVSDVESKIHPNGVMNRFLAWNGTHPVLAVLIVSFLAVVISCYPVLFCNRSYVSPTDVRGALARGWWAPSSSDPPSEVTAGVLQHGTDTHGSDTAAEMWWGVPVGFIESRSLLEHGEIPLWNRYSHAGDTLIGQGISMLGDPLQLIVIFGHGSAWAWDIKFLAAKLLFCLGFGLLILRLLSNRPLSLIYAALAAYSGAFFFINNHPTFFVLAYAPWILLAAIEWLDSRSGWHIGWGLAWLVANVGCLNGGHVEVGVDLIGGLNLAALAYGLSGCERKSDAAKVLKRLGVATLCFLGLTAPVWISFLVSLEGAYSSHAEIQISQLPLTSLAGAFDEIFYRALLPNDYVGASAPGTSLLILVGCVISLWRWRQLKGDRFFWVNLGAIALWGGCVFELVPAFLLAKIPLWNRVAHLDVDLSFLLVLHLTIQSAYGFKSCLTVKTFRQFAGDLACIVAVLAALTLLFFCGPVHRPIPWNYVLCSVAGAVGAPLLFIYLNQSGRQTFAGWLGIILLGFIPNFRDGFYHRGNGILLMLPGPRVSLNASSPAIDRLKTDQSGPFRIAGLDTAFVSDYSAVYELESIASCAPLSNPALIDLVRSFPGMDISRFWMISVLNPDQAQPLLNLLNVKYLLAAPDTGAAGKLQFPVSDRRDFTVLDNPQVWPRAFYANQVVPLATTADFVKYLSQNGSRPFVAVTPGEIENQPALHQLETTGPAVITPAAHFQLSANATQFDIHVPSPGVICLTEGQAKDFTATANGQPEKVLTVNRAFKGIYLDQPGDYHVEFVYRPRHWRLACALFWFSAGGAMLVSFRLLGIKRARTSPDRHDN